MIDEIKVGDIFTLDLPMYTVLRKNGVPDMRYKANKNPKHERKEFVCKSVYSEKPLFPYIVEPTL